MRDMRVAQVFNSCNLLPRSFVSQPSSVRQPKKLCLELRCVQPSIPSRDMGDFFSVFVIRVKFVPLLRSWEQRLTGHDGHVLFVATLHPQPELPLAGSVPL